MIALLAALVFAAPAASVSRTAYGVPLVTAPTPQAAFEACGFAVAQDRMWQMEMSRHLARASLASILGAPALSSDREVAKTAYTDAEIQAQIDRLSPFARSALAAYAAGVNRFLKTQKLPPEFAQNGDTPSPWSSLDSAAIAIHLYQEFGRGAAGQLRDLAFLQYAKIQPKLKDRAIEAMDDFAWQNDPAAVTTLAAQDDPVAKHPPVIYPPFDDATTQARLAEIPMPSLFELLPAVEMVERRTSNLVAEAHAVPYRTGSYCVVVSPRRSKTGHALLLSGPQMGFTTPSILHEISISAPGLHVSGADVPGVPGVVVGKTDSFAWGLTSGEAQSEDTVWSKLATGGYIHNGVVTPFIVKRRVIQVKGADPVTVVSKWTVFGPVVLESASKGVVFSRHASYDGKELRSLDAMFSIYGQQTAAGIDRAISPATMSFNFFFATKSGDIGYRYLGQIPLRAAGLDPRLPTPDQERYAWKGFVPLRDMPHVINPHGGVLANWNNKPVAWWPNGDTPLWGRIHPANALFSEVGLSKFGLDDLAAIVKHIALKDYTWPFFKKLAPPFDGLLIDGSLPAARYRQWLRNLRDRLIEPVSGNFLSPQIFDLVAQPTLIWDALHGRTRLDFLNGQTATQLAERAMPAPDSVEPYRAGGHPFGSLGKLEYADRGTYIQIVELLGSGPLARTALPPGEAASGPHAGDQLPLANRWSYKPMR